jgi:hypothetical protein
VSRFPSGNGIGREAASRASRARCVACNQRAEAWLCDDCGINSSTVAIRAARGIDEHRGASQAFVASQAQRRIASRVEWEDMLEIASAYGEENCRSGAKEQTRTLAFRARFRGFTREEMMRIDDFLRRVSPEFRYLSDHKRHHDQRRAAFSLSWKWGRFTNQWVSIGLQVITDYFTKTPRSAKRREPPRKIPKEWLERLA